MATLPPCPLITDRLLLDPGTLIRSPNVTTQVPGSIASSNKRSTYEDGVTHTGHPGPDIRCILGERSPGIPFLAIAPVWLPHTSMIFISGPS